MKASQESNFFPVRGRIRKKRSREQIILLYKRFLRLEDYRIYCAHAQGASGREVCSARATLLDGVLRDMLATLSNYQQNDMLTNLPFTLVATGGYGRGLLNPGSDLDLLFLLPSNAEKPDLEAARLIEDILYLLWDVGLKVGHAVRGLKSSLEEASKDPCTKCSFMEMRLIAGDSALFARLETEFREEVILKRESQFLDERREDLRQRQAKSSFTVFLQEPNVKQSVGGLRDYHLMRWICWVKRKTLDLTVLQQEGLLSKQALTEVEVAHEFLLRVRNELHYHTASATDLLTLRMQGVVAQSFAYPQKTHVRRIEAFMRDYYRHAQRVLQHSSALLETFEILAADDKPRFSFRALIPGLETLRVKEERFDGFFSREGRLYPQQEEIFEQDPSRLMRLFQHCQLRGLRIAPELKTLTRNALELVDSSFRRNPSHREIFEAILTRKGDVARSLRQMKRVDFLGVYVPEFGKIDCLVQHEFFHRYTADEHTLRTIEALDLLVASDRDEDQFYANLFNEIKDAPLFYLALLLHDTGRAEDVRQHEDGSAVLASRVCNRLGIRKQRRSFLMFLVVHHLTMFRVATTQNYDDPKVVRQFAEIVGTEERLNALMLFTWADAKGTSEDSWSSWKESMLRHLYHNTLLWWEKQEEAFHPDVSALQQQVEIALSSSYSAEIKAHFQYMPQEYFTLREAENIVSHIRLYRKFFAHLSQHKAVTDFLLPALHWKDLTDAGWTVLTLCTWDRSRLLERITAALTKHKINVLSAELHVRKDDTVLNTFRICTATYRPVSHSHIREQVEKDLQCLLGVEVASLDPAEFVQEARKQERMYAERKLGHSIPVRVGWNNEQDQRYTTIQIQAADRIGLLFEIFRVLGEHNLDVVYARIATEKGAAIDTLGVVDVNKRPLVDRDLLASVKQALEDVVGVVD